MKTKLAIALILAVGLVYFFSPVLLKFTATQVLAMAGIEVTKLEQLEIDLGAETQIDLKNFEAVAPSTHIKFAQLNLSLPTGSLLTGRLKFNHLNVQNWQITILPIPAIDNPPSESNSSEVLNSLLIDFSHPIHQFDELLLSSGRIQHFALEHAIELETVKFLSDERPAAKLEIEAVFSQPLDLNLNVSRSNELTNLSIESTWGQTQLSVDGELAQISPLNGLITQVKLMTPDPTPFRSLPGLERLNFDALEVSSEIKGTATIIQSKTKLVAGTTNSTIDLNHNLDTGVTKTNTSIEGSSLKSALALFAIQSDIDRTFSVDTASEFDSRGLNLQQLELSLEDANISASGLLPGFPSIDNWRLNLIGEQTINGHISLNQQTDNLSGEIKIQGDTNQLFALLGSAPTISQTTFGVDAAFSTSPALTTVLLESSALGDSQLNGELTITEDGDKPDYQIKLRSEQLNLLTFSSTDNDATEDTSRPDLLIPDIEIPFERLNAFTLDFSWEGRNITLAEGVQGEATLDFSVKDGRLESNEIHWQNSLNQGRINLSASALGDKSGHLKIEATSNRIPGLWLALGRATTNPDINPNFKAQLESSGHRTTEIASNLNGAVLFQGGSGALTANIDTVFGDFLSQMSSKVFGTGNAQTNIVCSAGAIQISGGEIQLNPGIGLRSDRFDILTSGSIKLPEEQLDLNLTSRSRKGLGVSAAKALVPNVGIGGTLATPKLNLGTSNTAISSGAAIASSGLSILATGLWDRIRSSVQNPCEALYQQALEGNEVFKALKE